jgi:deoxyribose-phosphate aldolase
MPFALQYPVPTVDAVGLTERAASFTRRSIKNEAKATGLRLCVSMMDLTTLEGADTRGKVTHLCRKARQPMDERFACPPCAAVCVYPNQVAHAVSELAGSGIPVASVATGFPSGQYPLELRLADVRSAVGDGAAEIDMVINRGTFLEGDETRVSDEIAAVKEACGPAHLKVIFETGELQTYDAVRRVSQIAIEAGADFIKTSTGKVTPAATLPVTLVLLETVRDHFLATGHRIGVKPAGGIRSAKEALQYLVMVKETLGDTWLTPDLFRFGASSLLSDVELQIAKLADGAYQSPDYFSKA